MIKTTPSRLLTMMKQTTSRLLPSLFLLSCCFSLSAHAETAHPSQGAKDMAGAKGAFAFKPSDWQQGKKTWWKDTDGIAPGVAGCHLGTNEQGETNGRMFGEACLDNGLLVESNPSADKVHGHNDDTGHPDTFDCNTWCIAEGMQAGQCEIAPAPPCEQSAMCVCK
ncbi:hypothetical protein [Shewanella sp.]|uniref:hypothetical protein n=1 Tax=Shewanella sp. TaxID=50422 RepID=UPI0040549441